MKPTVSIVIPIYKKAEMVMRNLRHNMPLFKGHEVVLIDDASGDGLADQLKSEFPHVIVLVNPSNLGFGPTVNRAVNAASGDFVILLGSDVILKKPFPADITHAFEDEKLFALSFMQEERDGQNIGKNRIYFHKGLPNHEKVSNVHPGLTAWADGGASIVRRDYFVQLGGFNELFAPFYWEDNDLSYRAYSRGWHVLFDPSIHVEHHHESTISSYYRKRYVTTIAYRNQFLFTWCNITDSQMWFEHVRYLLKYIVGFSLKGETTLVIGFLKALPKLAGVLAARALKKRNQKISDKEIYAMFE